MTFGRPVSSLTWLCNICIQVQQTLMSESLMPGNIEGKTRRGQQRMRWLDSIIESMDMNLSKLQEIAEMLLCHKGLSSQSYGFSSSHVWMWESDYKESWALKNWCFWTVVLEETLESPLDCKEIKPVSPRGNQSWIFTEKTDAETEAPILWPPDAQSWLNKKDPDARKEWG